MRTVIRPPVLILSLGAVVAAVTVSQGGDGAWGALWLEVARAAVGVTFLWAGIGKLTMPDRFAVTLRAFPVLARVVRHAGWARQVAVGLGWGEVLLGVSLVAGVWPAGAALIGLLVLATFTVALIVALLSGRSVSCGCLSQRGSRVGWPDVARNGVLMLLCGVVEAVPARSDALIDPVVRAALAALIIGVVAAWLRSSRPLRPAWVLASAADPGGSGRHLQGAWQAPHRSDGTAGMAMADSNGPGGTGGRAWEALLSSTQLERRAATAVTDLSVRLAPIASEVWLTGELARADEVELWVRDEAQLKAWDDELNAAIQGLYREVAEDEGTEQVSRLTRIALLHWATTLRRRAMRSYHTLVPGLTDDRECAGDFIGDSLLIEYAEALFLDSNRSDRNSLAVVPLAAMAQQAGCLGQAQLSYLASDLYWSFVEVSEFLRHNGLGSVVPYLAQAALQPMLLIYDVEKYRGPGSPLQRWFAEYQPALLEGARTGRLPAFWHGLWLYDRRTGHLLGYRAAVAPETENDVSLELFIRSITARQNLGGYECSFAEMIERGPSRLGYLCSGTNCGEDPQEAAGLTIGHRMWQRNRPSRRGLSRYLGATVGCAEPSGGAGSDGSRPNRCADGFSGGGRDRVASSVACLTERLMSSSPRQQLRCMAEAIGMCADPLEKVTKGLQVTTFEGVKTGKFCQLAQGYPTPYPGNTEEERRKNMEWAERNREAARAAYERASARAEAAREAERAALEKYQQERTREAREAYNEASIERQTREAEERYAQEQLDMREETLEKLREEENTPPSPGGDEPGTGVAHCPPDTPDCGGNGCTAMAAAAAAALKCLQTLQGEDRPDPWGGADPGVVDPSPLDDPAAPSWLSCFDTMEVDPTTRQCWAMDCGPGTEVTATAGRCGCQQAGLGQPGGVLQTMCGNVDCGDGVPAYDGSCRCTSLTGFDSIGSGGPIPIGPLRLEAPMTFRERRFDVLPGLLQPPPQLPR